MATATITEKDVRMFMMDKTELNPLLRGVRWSPEEIDAAIVNTIAYYNECPPQVDIHTVESFPHRYTLLIGVAGYLLKSAAINEASNNLQYSLDNVAVNDKDKADIFTRMGSQYWQEFQQQVQQIKAAKNIAAAFGSMFSEHRILAR